MLPTGTIVAGYRIDGMLGRGGMGVVYEATQLSLDRKVALKLIAPEMGADRALQERFRREGLRQAAIDHPHIVTVHEAGETEHGLYFAMRLVRGTTLKHIIGDPELDVDRTVRILSQIADALDTAHEAGLIHRDVKPQNILVGARDHAYLADFGLTKTAGDRSLTRSGGFVGTLDYVAPEQIRGEPTTARTDVYALAAVLYECLTGVVPYPSDTDAALLWAHVALAPPRASDKRQGIPAALDAVIVRGLAKKPGARFATAGEMLARTERSIVGGRVAAVDADTIGASVPPFVLPPATPEPSPTIAYEPAIATPPTRIGGAPPPPPPRVGGPIERTLRIPRVAFAIAAVLLAGALALVGYRSGVSSSDTAQDTRVLVAGRLRLQVPASWQRTTSPPNVPGLRLSSPASAAPGGVSGAGRGLIAGMSDGTGATLLPAAFLDRLPRTPGTDDVVSLGELRGYRFRDLRPRGLDRPVSLFVVPTAKGVATIACPGAAAGRASADCERAAATLALDGVRILPLGPREEYAKALNAAIEPLNATRDRARAALRRASSPGARARAAGELSQAFTRAAASLAGVVAGPAERPAHEALRDDIRGAAAAYSQLAAAARRESVVAFNKDASSVRNRESRAELDLRALARLGYSVK